MERQCLLVRVHLDVPGGGLHQRVVWLPVAHAKVHAPVPGQGGWVVEVVWHATRERAGEKGNEHWEYRP